MRFKRLAGGVAWVCILGMLILAAVSKPVLNGAVPFWGALLLLPPRPARSFSDQTRTLCGGGFSPLVGGCWRGRWCWGVCSPPFSFLQVSVDWVCLFFSCSWPDGLCGERCQIMKPISKAGISILLLGFLAQIQCQSLFLLTVNFLPDETFPNWIDFPGCYQCFDVISINLRQGLQGSPRRSCMNLSGSSWVCNFYQSAEGPSFNVLDMHRIKKFLGIVIENFINAKISSTATSNKLLVQLLGTSFENEIGDSIELVCIFENSA